MQNYIENSIKFEEFETAFSSLWNRRMREFQQIKLDLEQIKNFQPNPESANFCSYVTCVFRQFERLEDEVSTEQQVRDYIIDILEEIKNKKKISKQNRSANRSRNEDR